MKRVVADTNILVSALQFGGKPKHLFDLAIDGQIDLVISEAILAESLRVLRNKFNRTLDWIGEADQQLRVIARLVEPTESLQVIEADPTDDRILECAVAADAEVLVSGDRHLLSLGSFEASRSNASPSSSAASKRNARGDASRPRTLGELFVCERVARGRSFNS